MKGLSKITSQTRLNNKVIHSSAFPRVYYEQELGGILRIITSPIEIPYKLEETLRNIYYHLFHIKHTHDRD